jgi:hypothetical protein
MAVLFIPLLFGLNQLYIWTDPATVAQNELLQHKSIYLNIPFFPPNLVTSSPIACLFFERWSLAQIDGGPCFITACAAEAVRRSFMF